MKYDESDNIMIRATRVVTDKLSDVFSKYFYAHTNRFYVVQEGTKPEVLKVQTELARSVH